MNELMLFNNEEFGNVRMVEINGKAYAVGKDIATILGYKNTNDAISKHCKGVVKLNEFKINGIPIALIPQNDIIRLIQVSKVKSEEEKSKIKQWFIDKELIDDSFVIESRKEINFLDQLERSLEPFEIVGERQHLVQSDENCYKIDYYIPSLNIAIEYDESEHKNYTYDQHIGRQKEIEEKLDCKFIRVNDENTNDYNVGYVIKEIMERGNNICKECGCNMSLYNGEYVCGNCGSLKKYEPNIMF